MLNRENIRYGNFWVRLVCCLSVAIGVANLMYFQLLVPLEQGFCDIILEPGVHYHRLSSAVEVLIVLCVCIGSSILRIERPFVMLAVGTISIIAYALVDLGVYILVELTLPATSPLLAIVGSTAILGTMAWSEERSRRRKLEQLEHAKQQFTDMLVHDLRRRMSSILTSFSVLEKNAVSADRTVKELMSAIRITADRILLQMNALLDIRKIEEGRMVLQRERVPLCRVIRESLEEHQSAADLTGLRFVLNADQDLRVEIDASIFSRVLANLLWNALQHAPQGSEIEIGCSAMSEGKAGIFIANRGKPISREQQKHLFEPFASSRAAAGSGASTGLGLAFCRLALEAHGGAIQLESPCEKYGDGVKVIITLPLS